MIICNHQAESSLYVWSVVWSGDLQNNLKKDGYTWHWMCLLRPGVIKECKPNLFLPPSFSSPPPPPPDPLGWWSEYVNPYIPHTNTNPRQKSKWSYAITRLRAHCMYGLVSDLVICKIIWKRMVIIHDTECPYWNTGVIKQYKPNLSLPPPPPPLWGDEVSMLTHTYHIPTQTLDKNQSDHMQSPGWELTLCVVCCLIWWFAK